MLNIKSYSMQSLSFILFTLFSVGYSLQFTDKEKADITYYHNIIRGQISYVEAMAAIIWDDYIANAASIIAENYSCSYNTPSSSYRQYPDYKYFGETESTMGVVTFRSQAEVTPESLSKNMKSYGSLSFSRATAWRFGCGHGVCEDNTYKYFYTCLYFTGPDSEEPIYVKSNDNCTTCAAAGLECGTFTNSCGKKITCNSCKSTEKCKDNKCVCTPKTKCDDNECGNATDGCGGIIQCGECKGLGEMCNSIGECYCRNRITCINSGKECGVLDDGCGGNMTCGYCYGEKFCEDNMCKTCVHARTCEEYNISCGSIDSSCGYRVDCGTCPKGNTCVQGECILSGSFGLTPSAMLIFASLAILMILLTF